MLIHLLLDLGNRVVSKAVRIERLEFIDFRLGVKCLLRRPEGGVDRCSSLFLGRLKLLLLLDSRLMGGYVSRKGKWYVR